jgi:hypothetical protein
MAFDNADFALRVSLIARISAQFTHEIAYECGILITAPQMPTMVRIASLRPSSLILRESKLGSAGCAIMGKRRQMLTPTNPHR